jgi:DNA-binding PadR family transcriptional regulator
MTSLEQSYRTARRITMAGIVVSALLACGNIVVGRLEDDGFVERHDFREVPPRVAYSLTPLGREVARHVAALGKWVGDHAPAIVAAREQRRRSNPKRRARSTQVSTASREQPVSIAVTTR